MDDVDEQRDVKKGDQDGDGDHRRSETSFGVGQDQGIRFFQSLRRSVCQAGGSGFLLTQKGWRQNL